MSIFLILFFHFFFILVPHIIASLPEFFHFLIHGIVIDLLLIHFEALLNDFIVRLMHLLLHTFHISICVLEVVYQLFLHSVQHHHFSLDVQFLRSVVELVFLHLTNHLLKLLLKDTVLFHVVVVVYHDHAMSPSLTKHVESLRNFTHVFVLYTMILDHTSEILNNDARRCLEGGELSIWYLVNSATRLCLVVCLGHCFSEFSSNERLIED